MFECDVSIIIPIVAVLSFCEASQEINAPCKSSVECIYLNVYQFIFNSTMINLQVAKWGNSLAVRIPADYVRQIGVKEGDQLQAHLGADGALNLRAANWSRQSFAQDLANANQAVPMGTSVMEQLRSEARY